MAGGPHHCRQDRCDVTVVTGYEDAHSNALLKNIPCMLLFPLAARVPLW